MLLARINPRQFWSYLTKANANREVEKQSHIHFRCCANWSNKSDNDSVCLFVV